MIDESPSDFIRNYRLTEAKSLLKTTDLNVSEVAWKVGSALVKINAHCHCANLFPTENTKQLCHSERSEEPEA